MDLPKPKGFLCHQMKKGRLPFYSILDNNYKIWYKCKNKHTTYSSFIFNLLVLIKNMHSEIELLLWSSAILNIILRDIFRLWSTSSVLLSFRNSNVFAASWLRLFIWLTDLEKADFQNNLCWNRNRHLLNP